jgi:hypothetical protein
MLPGLTKQEFRELILSVGTHRITRPLSPVEVGQRFAAAIECGASKAECAQATQLKDTTMVGRFLRLTALDPSIRHLVDWGESADECVGFSTAVEIARLPSMQQRESALAVLEHRLTKNELISVFQLVARSGETIGSAVARVVHRRPVRRHVEVIMGTLDNAELGQQLAQLTQHSRNDLLKKLLTRLVGSEEPFSARLGVDMYSLVGGESLARRLRLLADLKQTIVQGLSRLLSEPSR